MRCRLGLSAVVLAGGLVVLNTGLSAADPSPSCSPPSNQYSASASQLQACGYSEAPFSGTTSLAGGGTSYNYTLPDGQTFSMLQPPAGFNPATASAAEDNAYGVPPDPGPLSPGYGQWQSLTDGIYGAVPQHSYLVVGTQPGAASAPGTTSNDSLAPQGQVSSSNYAGYSDSASAWTETQNSFIEPQFGNTGCSGSLSASFWAGIGGGSDLGQAGTLSGAGGPLHQVFYETLPAGPVEPGITVPANQSVIANVQYNSSNGNWSYDVDVNGTNHLGSGSGNYNGSNAFAIMEKSTTYLYNFKSVSMAANDGRGLSPMAGNTQYNLSGYATTGPISKGDFTVTQNSCSG